MRKYLGEFDVEIDKSPFASYGINEWVMEYLSRYSQIDGAHHKQWVLDQIARITKGTKVIVKVAKWSDGSKEYRFRLDSPSQEYLNWIDEMKGEWVSSEEYVGWEYSYDEGVAP